MWAGPVRLPGAAASLVPLSHDHAQPLARAAADGDLHALWYTSVPSTDGMKDEIARRLALRDAGSMVPFTVLDADAAPVGMTTYMNIDAPNRRLEIGSTWLGRGAQRGAINTTCKRLLLGHAFEALDVVAVEFRTHVLNTQSRRAIERLGARFDGILRAHMILPNGTLRDSAVYSIVAPEWPTVRAHLDWQLRRPRD